MAFALVSPKAGRSPYWRVRGTEYGISIDRSTKVADKVSSAKLLKQRGDEAKRQHLRRRTKRAVLPLQLPARR
jgi:hypothetical protein